MNVELSKYNKIYVLIQVSLEIIYLIMMKDNIFPLRFAFVCLNSGFLLILCGGLSALVKFS